MRRIMAAQLIRRRASGHIALGSRGIVKDTRYRSTFVISIAHFDVRRNFANATRPRIGLLDEHSRWRAELGAKTRLTK